MAVACVGIYGMVYGTYIPLTLIWIWRQRHSSLPPLPQLPYQLEP